MIAIVTALREELAPLLRRAAIERVARAGRRRCYVGTLCGRPVVLMSGGDGIARAEESLAALLQRFDVSLVIGTGIGGGIVPELRSGDLVVATKVIAPDGTETECAPLPVIANRAIIRSVARIAGSAAAKRELARDGAKAIDTESSGWARAAARAGVPFTVVRSVFDAVDEEIPSFVTASINGDGTIDRGAVARHALLHPRSIPTMLRMNKRLRAYCRPLGDFVARTVASLQLPPRDKAKEAHLDQLLIETSRTFALCIPLLQDSTRMQVTIAYLLFRIADTFEDASHWPVADRLKALEDFCALLKNGEQTILSVPPDPSPHAGYARLIADMPLVMSTFNALAPQARDVIRDHVIRSSQGMAHFVAMTDGDRLQLTDMQQLRDYCYAVAGIVGEMLTELFLLRAPQLRSAATFLRARAATFGEGLQLVNILKDSASDFAEGRSYIPPGVDRADVLALARADLESATEYTLALQNGGAPHGIVAFAALPVALAQATLDRLERVGAGAKIGRAEVFRITRHVNQSVARGEPPLRPRAQALSGLARMRSIFSLLFGNES
jgi:farnesyl-diphosphate farnesyltransferase